MVNNRMAGKSSGLLVGVLLAVAMATAAATALDCTLPENDSQVFPNPANCSTFYICSRGDPVLMTCPPGLIWNSNVSACDFPFNWECKDQPPEVDEEETLIEPYVSSLLKELEDYMAALVEAEDKSFKEEQEEEEDDDYYGEDADAYEDIPVPTCAPDANYTSFPNPYNCSQFYECDNGIAHLTDCPPGLHFNVEFGVCDFVWSANCTELEHNSTEVASFESSSEEEEIVFEEPVCPPPGGGGEPPRFPNGDNCTTYWICDNGKATLLACPAGLVYNPAVQACDFPWALNCTGICCPNQDTPFLIDEDKLDDVTTFAEPNCPPPGTGGEIPRFPNEDNCTTFWICDNGKAKLISCPNGLVYNPAIQNCDFAWALNCTGVCCPNKEAPKNIPEEVSVKFVDATEFEVPSCPPPGGSGNPPKFPNADNCTTYWVCDNGQAKLFSCPIGLVYNPAIENCDFYWALNCTGVCCPNKEAPEKISEVVPVKLVDVKDSKEPSCPPPGGGGHPPTFPNADNCTTYWICDNGHATLLSCPAGLVFNPAINACDFAWALNCTGVCCPNRVVPRTEITCPADPIEVVHIPNPEDCSSFYKCDVDQTPVLMLCPAGLEFNPVLLVCDYPENAQCSVQSYWRQRA